MSQITCTKHRICQQLAAQGACCSGFAVLVHPNYYGKHQVALLGRETGGTFVGQLNLTGGKAEASDQGCILRACQRELREEMKINLKLGAGNSFDTLFKNSSSGHFRYVIHQRTVVFIGVVPVGFSRRPYDQAIQLAHATPGTPHHLRELSEVQWVHLATGLRADGHPDTVSSFALAVLRQVNACYQAGQL